MANLDENRLVHMVHRVRNALSDFWWGRPVSTLDEVHEMPPRLIPQCPRCGAAMVRRTARKGSKAGRLYWGCELFPACRGARQVPS